MYNEKPCHIHGNGPPSSKHFLDSLYNQLTGNKNIKNNISKISFINKKIKILIYVEFDESYNCDKMKVKNILIKNLQNVRTICDDLFVDTYSSDSFFNVIQGYSLEEKRNSVLLKAKEYDYLFILNTLNIIEENTLQSLILENKNIITPLLSKPGLLWSNFWGEVCENGWYKTSPDYEDIVNYKKKGVFQVPHILGVYLIKNEVIKTRGPFDARTFTLPKAVYEKFYLNFFYIYTHHLHNKNQWFLENPI